MKWEKLKNELIKSECCYYYTDNGIILKNDCLEAIKKIPDEYVDFILSDYPFNSQDGRKDYIKFIYDLSEEYYRILKQNCVLLIINNPYNIWKTKNAYDKFTHRDSIALTRKGALRPAWRFGFQHNYLMTFVKGNNIRYKWNGTKKNHDKTFFTDVIEYQNSFRMKGGYFHPQAIPLYLTQKMVEIFTNKQDIVLDPFLGSGTTAIICEKLNRRWIGIEINENYCEMSKNRIKKETEQVKLF